MLDQAKHYKRTLYLPTRISIYKFLKDRLIPIGPRLVAYPEDDAGPLTDQRVADLFNLPGANHADGDPLNPLAEDVSPHSVANVRRKMFGDLHARRPHAPPTADDAPATRAELEALRLRVAALEELLKDLTP
jgi:hypothetical protein